MYLKCLSATGQLGYGIIKDSFFRGIEKKPDYIGADMGSTDPGPFSLGSGEIMKSRATVKSDLELIIEAAIELNVPAFLGTAGTAGGRPHLEAYKEIVIEIAHEKGLHFSLAVVDSELDKQYVKKHFKAGRIKAFQHLSPLKETDIDQSERIVGQMGIEPFVNSIEKGAQVVLAGRANDTSIFAALPIKEGIDPGLAYHMAKIVECASQCAVTGGRDAIMGYLNRDHFLIESQNPEKKVTPLSVAAHTLYEQVNPYEIHEPDGYVSLKNSVYEQYSEKIVKISGSEWVPVPVKTIKLEGAKKAGYRSLAMGGIRDPVLIKQVNEVILSVKKIVTGVLNGAAREGDDYSLNFRVYGKNGVMGGLETENTVIPHELFIIIDVLAHNSELAETVCGIAKQQMLHYFYPGIVGTGGNLAFPFAPDIYNIGWVYEFNIYHLMEVDISEYSFPIEIYDL